MFSLPVATVRKVLAFAYTAQLRDLLDARLAGSWPRESAYRFDRLARQLARIEKEQPGIIMVTMREVLTARAT
jgi:hypothetical protein